MFWHINPENFENSLKSPYNVKMKVGLFFGCGQPLFEISVHSFLITFEPILDVFLRFWTKPEIQDGGPRWPPLKNGYVIITSCDLITSGCGPQRRQFQTYYPPSKCRCHSVYILGVSEWGNPGIPWVCRFKQTLHLLLQYEVVLSLS